MSKRFSTQATEEDLNQMRTEIDRFDNCLFIKDSYEEYLRYCPLFLLSPAGLRATLTSMKFDWRRLLRKEYGTTFTGLTAILLLLTWNEYQVLGAASAKRMLSRTAAIWLPVLAAYFAVLILKKKGSLGKG